MAIDITSQTDKQLARYTSRKFVLAILAVLSSTVLVWQAKISDGVYSSVMIAIIAAYYTANVTQKKVEKPDA